MIQGVPAERGRVGSPVMRMCKIRPIVAFTCVKKTPFVLGLQITLSIDRFAVTKLSRLNIRPW